MKPYEYGNILYKRKEYSKAFSFYEVSAQDGIVSAMNSLGYMYYSGNGVKQSYAEAVKWFKKAADKGDSSAMYHLSSMYASGKGVIKNKTTAIKWSIKATAAKAGGSKKSSKEFR